MLPTRECLSLELSLVAVSARDRGALRGGSVATSCGRSLARMVERGIVRRRSAAGDRWSDVVGADRRPVRLATLPCDARDRDRLGAGGNVADAIGDETSGSFRRLRSLRCLRRTSASRQTAASRNTTSTKSSRSPRHSTRNACISAFTRHRRKSIARRESRCPSAQRCDSAALPCGAASRLINGYSPIRPAGVAREFDFAIHGEIAPWAGEFFPGMAGWARRRIGANRSGWNHCRERTRSDTAARNGVGTRPFLR